MKTIRTITAVSALAALALPVGAAAKPDGPTGQDKSNAARECKQLRGTTDASREAFAAQFRTFGACVSQQAREERSERRSAWRSASRSCREERETLGLEAFRQKYGTNANRRNAFGKCVSRTAKAEQRAEDADDAEQAEERKNAAEACDAERGETEESQAAFTAKYGTNGNGRNAFGKCVSAQAEDDDADDAS